MRPGEMEPHGWRMPVPVKVAVTKERKNMNETITLRQITDNPQVGDYWKDGQGRFWPVVKWRTTDGIGTTDGSLSATNDGPFFRKVSHIPEGYEECDLALARQVLIGGTWLIVVDGTARRLDSTIKVKQLEGLGVLAIRPIPEPEPTEIIANAPLGVGLPDSWIGKKVKITLVEVVKP